MKIFKRLLESGFKIITMMFGLVLAVFIVALPPLVAGVGFRNQIRLHAAGDNPRPVLCEHAVHVPRAQVNIPGDKSEIRVCGTDARFHRSGGILEGNVAHVKKWAYGRLDNNLVPEVLLLDEPLSALDSETRAKLRKELRRIHSVIHTTMIHVTHSFDEAFLLGSRMAIMHNGEIVQAGEPSEVFRKPNCRFVAEFLGVTNIFQGKSIIDNGNSCINVNGLKITSATARDGKIYASIRPEDILVSLGPIESSARNSFQGEIQDISDAGIVLRITVDAGVPFVAAITRRSFLDMGLRQGQRVFLTFKAADVHVF